MADDAGPSVASTAQDYPATTGLSAAATAAPSPVDSGFLTGVPSTSEIPPINIEQYRKDESALLEQKIGLEGHYAREQVSKDREFENAMKHKFAQESASLEDMKPWNPQTMAPPRTSLWEQFGSPGFVFAMLASSFSAMPMNSALGAGAAAMNAINVGDMDAYDRAFNEWKVNTDLAIKRHGLEHTEFEDIATLWDKDKAAGRTRLEAYLTQINDKRKLALLRSGMDKETWDAIEGQHRAMEQVIKLQPAMLETNAMIDAFNKGVKDGKDPLTALTEAERKIAEAKHPRYETRGSDPQLWDRADKLFPNDPQKQADWVAEQKVAQKPEHRTADSELWDRAEELFPGDDQKQADWVSDQKAKSHPAKVSVTEKSKDDIKKDIKTEHPDWSDGKVELEANKQIAESKKVITANKAADLKIAEDRYTTGIETIDKLVKIVEKHVGAVGAAGYATRAAESMSNILGSDETDRREAESLIAELQTIAPRLITESTSRPLAGEHEKVNKVVRGLSAGDTRPNALRNWKDLRQQFVRMKQSIENARTGKETEAPPGKTETPSGGTPEWQRGTVVGD